MKIFPRLVTAEKNSPTAVPYRSYNETKMGARCLGILLGHPALGVINNVDWPSRLWDGRHADDLSP
jgi:hypothetical protein